MYYKPIAPLSDINLDAAKTHPDQPKPILKLFCLFSLFLLILACSLSSLICLAFFSPKPMVRKKARLRLKQAKPPNLVGGSKQCPAPFCLPIYYPNLSTSLFLPVLSRVCSNKLISPERNANVRKHG